MAAPPDPRALAWSVLVAVEGGAFADAELGGRLATTRLSPRDQALATRLVYGTLAWQGYFDFLLQELGRPAENLDPPLRSLLRLALLQLTKLSRVPDFAAVDTAVELSKSFRQGATSGLVNALLRRFLRERERLVPPVRERDLAGHLAVALSHPRWLVERWLSELGAAETEALLAADNESAPTVLRVNRLRASRPRLLEQLERAGLRVRASAAAPDAVVLESGADPAALPGFAGGEFSSEGEASQLVTLMVGAHPGDQVLDACAAPGGKATYLAEQMENRGHVLAVDVNRIGLDHLVQAAGRLGIDCIEAAVGDAADRDVTGGRSFDRVLLDAPCSGLGTLRQHPEIRWRRSPETLIQAAKGQLRLLRALAERVRPGGTLTYATCTLVRVENDDVVGAFLHDHPGFAIDEPASLPAAVQPYVDAGGVLRTWPHRDGLDGFFAVRLKRRG